MPILRTGQILMIRIVFTSQVSSDAKNKTPFLKAYRILRKIVAGIHRSSLKVVLLKARAKAEEKGKKQ
jgi:hypothetical protein